MKHAIKLNDADWKVSIMTVTSTDVPYGVTRYVWEADAANIQTEPLQSNKSCTSIHGAENSWVRFARKNNYPSFRFEK